MSCVLLWVFRVFCSINLVRYCVLFNDWFIFMQKSTYFVPSLFVYLFNEINWCFIIPTCFFVAKITPIIPLISVIVYLCFLLIHWRCCFNCFNVFTNSEAGFNLEDDDVFVTNFFIVWNFKLWNGGAHFDCFWREGFSYFDFCLNIIHRFALIWFCS